MMRIELAAWCLVFLFTTTPAFCAERDEMIVATKEMFLLWRQDSVAVEVLNNRPSQYPPKGYDDRKCLEDSMGYAETLGAALARHGQVLVPELVAVWKKAEKVAAWDSTIMSLSALSFAQQCLHHLVLPDRAQNEQTVIGLLTFPKLPPRLHGFVLMGARISLETGRSTSYLCTASVLERLQPLLSDTTVIGMTRGVVGLGTGKSLVLRSPQELRLEAAVFVDLACNLGLTAAAGGYHNLTGQIGKDADGKYFHDVATQNKKREQIIATVREQIDNLIARTAASEAAWQALEDGSALASEAEAVTMLERFWSIGRLDPRRWEKLLHLALREVQKPSGLGSPALVRRIAERFFTWLHDGEFAIHHNQTMQPMLTIWTENRTVLKPAPEAAFSDAKVLLRWAKEQIEATRTKALWGVDTGGQMWHLILDTEFEYWRDALRVP